MWEILKLYFKELCFILIDEYDTPIQAGYFKAFERTMERNRFKYKIAVPNIEVRTIFEEMIIKFLEDDEDVLIIVQDILNSLRSDNFNEFEEKSEIRRIG